MKLNWYCSANVGRLPSRKKISHMKKLRSLVFESVRFLAALSLFLPLAGVNAQSARANNESTGRSSLSMPALHPNADPRTRLQPNMGEVQQELAVQAHIEQICRQAFRLTSAGEARCKQITESIVESNLALPPSGTIHLLEILNPIEKEVFNQKCERISRRLNGEHLNDNPSTELCRTLFADFTYRAKFSYYLETQSSNSVSVIPANESGKAKRVRSCYRSGAITEWMMQQCMGGEKVDRQNFINCVSGADLCLGERQPTLVPNSGITGGGWSTTGSAGELILGISDARGVQTSFIYFPLSATNPTLVVNMSPESLQIALRGVDSKARLQFALPAIPDLRETIKCRDEARTRSFGEDGFSRCVVERALPQSYRVSRACLESNKNSFRDAVVCSVADDRTKRNFKKYSEAYDCISRAKDRTEAALCTSEPFLGEKEKHWVGCIANNKSSFSAAAICGLVPDLTPEQQIAVGCAVKTGGVPKAFVICTAGQLAAREFDKCWEGGIGTDTGCYGPNNEIRKYWSTMDGVVKNAFGENSDFYKTFDFFRKNVYDPGAGHELVRAANTVLGDLKNGPGQNNDVVRAVDTINSGLSSVGSAAGSVVTSITGWRL
jgi:hypothetical protein